MQAIHREETLEHLKAFLKNKQAQDQSKAPKYGMRKLSVGFVSCF